MASLKKKIIVKTTRKISAQKSKSKKADDFTVNTATGKRTISGSEARRRQDSLPQNRLVRNRSDNSGSINDWTNEKQGQYRKRLLGSQNLPISTGGKRAGVSYGVTMEYTPAGTRTKRQRGR